MERIIFQKRIIQNVVLKNGQLRILYNQSDELKYADFAVNYFEKEELEPIFKNFKN